MLPVLGGLGDHRGEVGRVHAAGVRVEARGQREAELPQALLGLIACLGCKEGLGLNLNVDSLN